MYKNQAGQIRPVDIFLLFILLALVIGGVVYYFRSISPTQSERVVHLPQLPYDQVDTDQNTYTIHQHGVSLMYPATWSHTVVAEQPIAGVEHIVQFAPTPNEIIETGQYSVLVHIMNSTAAEAAIANHTARTILFNGNTAYQYEVVLEESKDYVVILPHSTQPNRWVMVRMTAATDLSQQAEQELYQSFTVIAESLRTF